MVKLSLLKGIVLPVPNCLIATEQLDTLANTINADAITLSGGDDLGETPERDKRNIICLIMLRSIASRSLEFVEECK